MASFAVMAAVNARLDAVWSRTLVRYPNAADAADGIQVPADKSPFLAVQYPLADEEQITVGAPGHNVFREEGVIRFVLQIPRGAGVEEYSGWLDELRAAFRGKQFGGVTTYAASPATLDDRNEDGGYWALSCAVPYKFDLFG
ncbi:phage tail terminator-like protein [Xanthobacter aminoxidans]|uniref:Phage tail terminator-like protein n=1 Tax=Xanthobacter aminoxidans TaxID=186280 RepID=A0ABW6ZAF6_9HYPH